MIWGKKEPTVEEREVCSTVTRTGLCSVFSPRYDRFPPVRNKDRYLRPFSVMLSRDQEHRMTQHELAGKNLCWCVNVHLLQCNSEAAQLLVLDRSKCCNLTKTLLVSCLDDEPTVNPPWFSHNQFTK